MMQYMPSRRDHDRRLLGFARELRVRSTDAEKRLWRILRSRKLAGYKFRRQYPIEGYIVDFFCIGSNLVVELDGGQHNEPLAKEYDARRSRRLNELGIQVIRFWDHDVLKHSSEVAESIFRTLSANKPSPQPSPGVPGEGAERVLIEVGETS
jgi:very-short-patch-repair endonuclease